MQSTLVDLGQLFPLLNRAGENSVGSPQLQPTTSSRTAFYNTALNWSLRPAVIKKKKENWPTLKCNHKLSYLIFQCNLYSVVCRRGFKISVSKKKKFCTNTLQLKYVRNTVDVHIKSFKSTQMQPDSEPQI